MMRPRALRTRMQELKKQKVKITESAIAQRLHLTRGAVAKWKTGETWPRLLEEQRLEEVLAVRPGFFAGIAAGLPYEQAKRKVVTGSEYSPTVHQLEQLLDADPGLPAGPLTMGQLQAHIRSQIAILFRFAYPHAQPVPAAIETARELSRSLRDPRPLEEASEPSALRRKA